MNNNFQVRQRHRCAQRYILSLASQRSHCSSMIRPQEGKRPQGWIKGNFNFVRLHLWEYKPRENPTEAFSYHLKGGWGLWTRITARKVYKHWKCLKYIYLINFFLSKVICWKPIKGRRSGCLYSGTAEKKRRFFLTTRLSRENETFSDSLQQKHLREKNLSEVTKLCGQKKKERETELGCLGAGWGPSQWATGHFTIFPKAQQWRTCPPTRDTQETQVWLLGREDPRRRKWHPLQYSCVGNPMHRSLVGHSPWGHKEADMTDWAHTHTWDAEMTSQRTGACSCAIGVLLKMWFQATVS